MRIEADVSGFYDSCACLYFYYTINILNSRSKVRRKEFFFFLLSSSLRVSFVLTCVYELWWIMTTTTPRFAFNVYYFFARRANTLDSSRSIVRDCLGCLHDKLRNFLDSCKHASGKNDSGFSVNSNTHSSQRLCNNKTEA